MAEKMEKTWKVGEREGGSELGINGGKEGRREEERTNRREEENGIERRNWRGKKGKCEGRKGNEGKREFFWSLLNAAKTYLNTHSSQLLLARACYLPTCLPACLPHVYTCPWPTCIPGLPYT